MKNNNIPASVRNEVMVMPVTHTGPRKPVLEIVMNIVQGAFALVALGAVGAVIYQLCA